MDEDSKLYLTPLQKAYLEANPEASLAEDALEREDAPESAEQERQKTSWSERNGIGGLLAIAVIGAFLGPILSSGRYYGELRTMEYADPSLLVSQSWKKTELIVWALFWVSTTASVFAGFRLINKRQASTVRIVIWCLWIGGPVVTMFSALLLPGIGAEGPQIAASLVLASLWTTYFLTSRRIKNTYGRGSTE